MDDTKLKFQVNEPTNIPSNDQAEEIGKQESKSLNLLNEKALEATRGLVHSCITYGGRTLLFILLCVLIARAAHLIIPQSWMWLSPERLKDLDHIIVGLFAGIIARVFPRFK